MVIDPLVFDLFLVSIGAGHTPPASGRVSRASRTPLEHYPRHHLAQVRLHRTRLEYFVERRVCFVGDTRHARFRLLFGTKEE